MKKLWMLVVSYDEKVALICLSDDYSEIERYDKQVPTDDPRWKSHVLEHDRGLAPGLAVEFREMARNGLAFVGRFAHVLGIAADLEAKPQ